MSGLLGNSDCQHSLQHNKGIEIIEIPHAFVIAWKYHLELFNHNENSHLAFRHISLLYTQTVFKSDN